MSSAPFADGALLRFQAGIKTGEGDMGAMGDIEDPAELTKLLSIGRVVNDPGTVRAQNTGDKQAMDAVIDRVRAILLETGDAQG